MGYVPGYCYECVSKFAHRVCGEGRKKCLQKSLQEFPYFKVTLGILQDLNEDKPTYFMWHFTFSMSNVIVDSTQLM